jgi:RNA polymerase sigma-70 factor (ECF subfamily)
LRGPETPRAGEATIVATSGDAELVSRLRAGDERAFEAFVDGLYGPMLAVAQNHVRSRAVAEEVVQETWLGVVKGLDRFEQRSSLKTWVFRILMNIARTRGVREARSVPYSALGPPGEEPAVDPDRFRGREDAFPGHWRAYPGDWHGVPEAALLEQETMGVVMRAIEELPPSQRAVITMRDVAGCSPEDVCDELHVSDGNQRVLLHRARSRVRSALERHLDG